MQHTPQIGEVYYTSFGYDETHYHFIKIVGFTASGKSAICQRVYVESVEGGNMVYDSIKPTDKVFGPKFKLLIRNRPDYTVLRGRYPRGIAQNTYMSSEPESFFKCEPHHRYMETNPQFGH